MNLTDHIENLFQLVPASTMARPIMIVLLSIGAGLVLLSVIIKFIRRKTKNKLLKKIIREFPNGFMIFGIVDLILVWMRLEYVPFFAMRIWWIIYLICFVVWIIFKIRKSIIVVKRIKRAKKS